MLGEQVEILLIEGVDQRPAKVAHGRVWLGSRTSGDRQTPAGEICREIETPIHTA